MKVKHNHYFLILKKKIDNKEKDIMKKNNYSKYILLCVVSWGFMQLYRKNQFLNHSILTLISPRHTTPDRDERTIGENENEKTKRAMV